MTRVALIVLALVGIVAAAVFVPFLHWLGPVLVAVLAVGFLIWDLYARLQWRREREADEKDYRDVMAAFGVKRNGRKSLW